MEGDDGIDQGMDPGSTEEHSPPLYSTLPLLPSPTTYRLLRGQQLSCPSSSASRYPALCTARSVTELDRI